MFRILLTTLTVLVLFSCSKDDDGSFNDLTNGTSPELKYFSPSEGREGTYVVIEGIDFSPNLNENELYFNGIKSVLIEGNDSVLVTTVPQGATSGKITININGMVDTSGNEFTVTDNPWLKKDGIWGRSEAIAFTVNNNGYCGLGVSVSTYFKDIYKYNVKYDNWEQMNDFGGEAREQAVAFTAGGKAYVGLGEGDGYSGTYLKDFWEFTPETDTWKQISDYPGGGRWAAVAFVCNDKGYVGLGRQSVYDTTNAASNFYSYDPSSGTWEALTEFPGSSLEHTTGFVIGDVIYIGSGSYPTSTAEFWKYNTITDTWTQTADFGGGARATAVGFSLNNMGYVGTGADDTYSTGKKDFWKYNPTTDTWTQVTDYFGGYVYSLSGEDGQRTKAVAFTVGGYAYVGTGDGIMHSRGDFWEYNPE